MTHTFAVCAYGDSPYLGACLKSLKNQSVSSEIILCTSTPGKYIYGLAEKYEIPVYVRDGEKGIGRDWNFAFDTAKSELVTLAHQDDLYERDYTRMLFRAKRRYPDMSVFTTASVTLKNGKMQEWGTEEKVKKLLRMPLRLKCISAETAVKRAALRFGNPLICPSCTYDKRLTGNSPFSESYQFILDWDLLWRLAEKPGRFVLCEFPLMLYRIHAAAATKACIGNHVREKEEAEMFNRIWPAPVAKRIGRLYRRSYEAYTE